MKRFLTLILLSFTLTASAARYLIIRVSDGVCVNVVEWDGKSKWSPPPGHIMILETNGVVQPLDVVPNTNDVKSVIKFVPPTPETNRIDLLEKRIQDLEKLQAPK